MNHFVGGTKKHFVWLEIIQSKLRKYLTELEREFIMNKSSHFKPLSKMLLCALIIGILCISTAVAFPTLNIWLSDKEEVYYTAYDGTYYLTCFSSDSTFTSQFRSAVSTARSQWNAVLPIGISEASSNAALNFIYGGTRGQLLNLFPALPTTVGGQTYVLPDDDSLTFVQYGKILKQVYTIYPGNSRYCLVQRSDVSANMLKNVSIYEMGHLFGWQGHSLNENDIMYKEASEKTTLGSGEKII